MFFALPSYAVRQIRLDFMVPSMTIFLRTPIAEFLSAMPLRPRLENTIFNQSLAVFWLYFNPLSLRKTHSVYSGAYLLTMSSNVVPGYSRIFIVILRIFRLPTYPSIGSIVCLAVVVAVVPIAHLAINRLILCPKPDSASHRLYASSASACSLLMPIDLRLAQTRAFRFLNTI